MQKVNDLGPRQRRLASKARHRLNGSPLPLAFPRCRRLVGGMREERPKIRIIGVHGVHKDGRGQQPNRCGSLPGRGTLPTATMALGAARRSISRPRFEDGKLVFSGKFWYILRYMD